MFQLYGRTLDLTRTAVHYSMFAILGLMMSIPGPTLIDLAHSSGTDPYSISFIFTARSIGYLIGSLTGGIILDYLKNEQLALIISSLFVSLGSYTIPWCRSLTILLVTFVITGFAMGFSNTGSNAFCLRIWGKKGAPYLQGLHFAYGCGGFFAPLLAAPFLSEQILITEDLSLQGVMQNFTELFSEAQNTSDTELKFIASETSTITVPPITFAYTIIGVLATLTAGCFIFVYIFSSREQNAVEKEEKVNISDPGLTFTIVVVVLACLQTGIVAGVEISFTQMLTFYVVQSTHNLSKITGSYMTSVYWGAFTVTRGFSIGLACKVNIRNLLLFDLILSLTAAVILLTIGTWSVPALWVGTALLGIGVASIFPASLSWVQKYICINNRIASIFTLVSSVLEMTVPLFISRYLGSRPNILFQFITAALIFCCVIFGSLTIILTRKGERYEAIPTKGKSSTMEEVLKSVAV